MLEAVVDREIDRAVAARVVPGDGDLAEEYARALASLDVLGPLLSLLLREGARLPHLDRVRDVLAETGAPLDAERLRARMDAGDLPPRDADAVASVVQMALVGHHLARRFFRGPVGVDDERFVATLAALVEGTTTSAPGTRAGRAGRSAGSG